MSVQNSPSAPADNTALARAEYFAHGLQDSAMDASLELIEAGRNRDAQELAAIAGHATSALRLLERMVPV
jgi:hypothetical protein